MDGVKRLAGALSAACHERCALGASERRAGSAIGRLGGSRTHRHELHRRRHRRRQRDRHLQLAALAAHRPLPAQRVLDEVERSSAPCSAPTFASSSSISLRRRSFDRSRNRFSAAIRVRQRVVPAHDKLRDVVARRDERGRRRCRAPEGRRSRSRRSNASPTTRCPSRCR